MLSRSTGGCLTTRRIWARAGRFSGAALGPRTLVPEYAPMNIFADFNDRIIKAVEALDLKDKDGNSADLSRITVEPPRDASHGDLATNAAMVLAKPAGQNPRKLAEKMAETLRADGDVAAVEVAG